MFKSKIVDFFGTFSEFGRSWRSKSSILLSFDKFCCSSPSPFFCLPSFIRCFEIAVSGSRISSLLHRRSARNECYVLITLVKTDAHPHEDSRVNLMFTHRTPSSLRFFLYPPPRKHQRCFQYTFSCVDWKAQTLRDHKIVHTKAESDVTRNHLFQIAPESLVAILSSAVLSR